VLAKAPGLGVGDTATSGVQVFTVALECRRMNPSRFVGRRKKSDFVTAFRSADVTRECSGMVTFKE